MPSERQLEWSLSFQLSSFRTSLSGQVFCAVFSCAALRIASAQLALGGSPPSLPVSLAALGSLAAGVAGIETAADDAGLAAGLLAFFFTGAGLAAAFLTGLDFGAAFLATTLLFAFGFAFALALTFVFALALDFAITFDLVFDLAFAFTLALAFFLAFDILASQ
jgi:hypothetical protein